MKQLQMMFMFFSTPYTMCDFIDILNLELPRLVVHLNINDPILLYQGSFLMTFVENKKG
jgi:hypothetical protein